MAFVGKTNWQNNEIVEASDLNRIEQGITELDNNLTNKSNKSSIKTATLTSSAWVGTSAPYTYTRAVTGVTTTNLVEVTYPSTITDAQLTAYEDAQIKKITQSTDTLTLYAYGTKPIIDLPITVIVRGDV